MIWNGWSIESSAVRLPRQMHSNPPRMTILCVGACLIGADADMHEWDHWCGQADTAIYRAKRLDGKRAEGQH